MYIKHSGLYISNIYYITASLYIIYSIVQHDRKYTQACNGSSSTVESTRSTILIHVMFRFTNEARTQTAHARARAHKTQAKRVRTHVVRSSAVRLNVEPSLKYGFAWPASQPASQRWWWRPCCWCGVSHARMSMRRSSSSSRTLHSLQQHHECAAYCSLYAFVSVSARRSSSTMSTSFASLASTTAPPVRL